VYPVAAGVLLAQLPAPLEGVGDVVVEQCGIAALGLIEDGVAVGLGGAPRSSDRRPCGQGSMGNNAYTSFF
jgi:hypothetical protein